MAYLRMSYFGTGTMKFFAVTSAAQFAVFRLTEFVCEWSSDSQDPETIPCGG